jgi:hypothetical protein
VVEPDGRDARDAAARQQATEDEVLEQLRQLRIEDVLVQLATSLISLAYLRLGEETRDLPQAQLAIDSLKALMPLLEGKIPADLSRDLDGVSLLHVAIATGRTHQIRVHLSAIGHPIVGDSTYGGLRRRTAGHLRAVQRLERPFLHSARLAFTHPADGRRVEFDSPLPLDLQSVLDEIEDRNDHV